MLSNAEKLASVTLSPRTMDEKSIAAVLVNKKMKRRTRSSLGGSEEFIKGFELNGVAMAAEERKPLSSIQFRGHRRAGSGNVMPKVAESPRAKIICTPQGVEKNAVAKIASSLFHSPTKLERSTSLSRVAHRVIPGVDGSTPRCRTGVGEVVLPGKQDALAELKRQDFQKGVKSKLQENGSGRRSCSVRLEKKLEGPGALKTGKTTMPCAHDNDENLHRQTSVNHLHGASTVFSANSWTNHKQMYWNLAYLPVKDIHPVCFETNTKLPIEQRMTSRSLDMGYDLHGFVRRSSSPTVPSVPLPCSSRGFNSSWPEAASELTDVECITPTLKLADSLHLEPQSSKLSSTHVENSYRINHRDVLSNSNSYPVGLETRSSLELQGQPFPITTPPRKRSLLDPSLQDFKNFRCHPLPLPPPSKTSQVEDKDGTQGMKQKKPASSSFDKVSDEYLTEATFLSSLLCENNPAGPVLISEEPKQLFTNASQVEEIVSSREKEVGLRNTSDPGACLRKSTSFEPGLEEKARIEHEKRTKLRKRRRSVSASDIGAMLLKIVHLSDTGPLEMRTVPITEPKISRVDSVQSMDCCVQTIVPSMGQSQPPTTTLNEGSEVETKTNNTEAIDMNVEYQDCSTELVAPDVDACHKVNVEDAYENKGTERLSEEEELQVVGDAQEGKIKNYAEGSQSDLVVHGSQEGDQIPEEGPGGSQKKRRGSKGRVSYDLDSSTDCKLKKADMSKAKTKIEHAQTTIDHSNKAQPLALLDENVAITRETRPRSFASMLQAPPGQSLDDYRLTPSSISILANPLFSSSHQDRLWEEQAKAYSSEGRGTPGLEDDTTANVFLHSPSPGCAILSADQIHSAAGSLRKGQGDTSVKSTSGFLSDTGLSNEKRKLGQGKKQKRPRTPLRSLLAKDFYSKTLSNHRSPESHGHFLQQLMSRIKGSSSSKSSSPKSQEAPMPKRRNTSWSSCLCFPH